MRICGKRWRPVSFFFGVGDWAHYFRNIGRTVKSWKELERILGMEIINQGCDLSSFFGQFEGGESEGYEASDIEAPDPCVLLFLELFGRWPGGTDFGSKTNPSGHLETRFKVGAFAPCRSIQISSIQILLCQTRTLWLRLR